MDYAGEELLRQRRVLAKLLLGAGESAVKGNGEDKTQAVTTLDMGDPEGETAAVGLISVFEDPGNSMDGGVLPAAAPPGGGSREYKGEAGVRRPAAEGLLGWAEPLPLETEAAAAVDIAGDGRRGAAAAPPGVRKDGGMAGAEEIWRRGMEVLRPEAAGRSARAATGWPEPGLGRNRTADWLGDEIVWERPAALWQAESGFGAEAMSRAFQRDARRYDGGFSLY